jgi:hypothetical protein
MLKHIGMHKTLGVRYVVVFREVPNEPESCLVIESDGLNPLVHDNLMNAIESTECQAAANLGEALVRKSLSTGENMLAYFHQQGLMKKISIDDVVLTPSPGSRVTLREINNIINGKEPGEGAPAEPTQNQTKVDPTAPVVEASSDAIEMAKKLLEQAVRLNPSLAGTTIAAPATATVTEVVKKPRKRRAQPKA